MRTRSLFAGALFLLLLGAGCAGAPTPEPPVSTFDVTKTECPGIADARQKVLTLYTDAVQAAEQRWNEARNAFQEDLNQCQKDVWAGGPCDKEWKESQTAAQRIQGDISNDDAYHGWKKAKANWDVCYGNWEARYKDWSDKGIQREQQCRDEFNAKNNAAQQAYTNAVKAAKITRDSDLAYLDDLEKKCKEKEKTQTGGGISTGGSQSGGVNVGATVTPGGTTTLKPWITTPPTVPRTACIPAGIPGSNATPRTGRATDFGPKDIATNLMVAVAEDVTKAPFPTGVIDTQIFAGMVCVKIRTRVAQMINEAADYEQSGRTALAQRINRKIEQYMNAQSVWCAIAEGKTSLPQIRKDAAAIGNVSQGICKTDMECGSPLCCSANSIATSHCNEEGQCVAQVDNCPTRDICMGPDLSQPLMDHCGPMHDGNWAFGQPKPPNSPANRPAPGVAK